MNAFEYLKSRDVSRLCHFTKLQSLAHILSSDVGVRASASIRADIKNVIDNERYDGELEHVCCSIEYPNSWFLEKSKIRNESQVFLDWVTLYIDLAILKSQSAKFCPFNASIEFGRHITKDVTALYNTRVGLRRIYCRERNMLSCCPTDGQAEVLIRDNIPRKYIIGIAVGTDDVAGRVYAMIKTYGIEQIPIYVAPDVLTQRWSEMIKRGDRPNEARCVWSEEE